jgi:flagellar biosynthesis protein FliQ
VLVSVIVSVTVEVSEMVFTWVVVLMVVFVTVVVCASLHPAREKSSEAEITRVNKIVAIFWVFNLKGLLLLSQILNYSG